MRADDVGKHFFTELNFAKRAEGEGARQKLYMLRTKQNIFSASQAEFLTALQAASLAHAASCVATVCREMCAAHR